MNRAPNQASFLKFFSGFPTKQAHTGEVRMGLTTSYNGFGPKIRDDSFRWMKEEIAAGRVEPPSQCSACGETDGHLDYHTEDYSLPFGPHVYAYPLCFRCHMMLHIRYRRRKDWLRYVEQLEAGAVYVPLRSRGEIHRISGSAWIGEPVQMLPRPRGRLEFFRGLSLERAQDPGQTSLFD
jgi:hypothetical protein